MALPSSGPISAAQINAELGRASNAPFSLGAPAERGLAGLPSGPISFSSFHGKASELVRTLSGGSGPVTLESLFTGPEWASQTPKRVVLPAGSERGSTDPAQAAVSIGGAFGGPLAFDVEGIISGASGVANGGTGGPALNTDTLGTSGQKLAVNLTGTIRAGGGGGGKGGDGGSGQYTLVTREPSSGDSYKTELAAETWAVFGSNQPYVYWGGTLVGNAPVNSTSVTLGAHTYFRGTFRVSSGGGQYYGIYRTISENVPSAPGTGGSGGRGEGYGQARQDGASGSPGGTNAGTGGSGGRGGLYGASGVSGATGTNGNVSSGLAGASPGLSGLAITNIANTTLNNNGTLLGRT